MTVLLSSKILLNSGKNSKRIDGVLLLPKLKDSSGHATRVKLDFSLKKSLYFCVHKSFVLLQVCDVL